MPLVDPQHVALVSARCAQPVSDPPTASERMARIQFVELLWILYEMDPDDAGLPGTQPRDVWDSMLGEPHSAMIAAGVAAIWP